MSDTIHHLIFDWDITRVGVDAFAFGFMLAWKIRRNDKAGK